MILLTAASEKFSDSLFALIYSLQLNWPTHPPLKIFDLGLAEATKSKLREMGFELNQVPPFCPHWRRHYTWKLWILHNEPSEHILWLDAGIFVLRPLTDVQKILESEPIFVVPNYQSLMAEAPPASVYSCGLTYAHIRDRSSISGNIIGVSKKSAGGRAIETAYRLALEEKNIAALDRRHKHDQALLSCVLYSQFEELRFYDGQYWAGWLAPDQVPGQFCWGQRRQILSGDLRQLGIRYFNFAGNFKPARPADGIPTYKKAYLYLRGIAARLLKRNPNNGLR